MMENTTMQVTLIFSVFAASLVYFAGRKDAARDPRLTGLALGLLTVYPWLVSWLPKAAVLPVRASWSGAAAHSCGTWVFAIWALGFAVLMWKLALDLRSLAVMRRDSKCIDHAGGVEIRALAGLTSPVAAGILRPMVFVPEQWHTWSAAHRQIALEHELAHHRRRDPWWRLLARIACAVHWWNPLVWWMARRLSVQCELACDAAVIRSGVHPGAYATLLCDLAENPIPTSGAVLAMASRSALEIRVRRLMHAGKSMGGTSIAVWVVMALISSLALAMLGAKAPGIEKFSAEEIQTRWNADPFPGENAL